MTEPLLLPPIPSLSEPPDWARLPIADCKEALVSLDSRLVALRSLYYERKVPGAQEDITVRAGVRDRLYQAAKQLPDTVRLCLFDGYRPLAVQRWLWDTFVQELRQMHPNASPHEITQMAHCFVASPSADPTCPPPHRTGGAVDVYLVDSETGQPLPMGTEPDETSPASATGWYEEHPEEPFTTHRRLLFHVMTAVGFTNYLGEWWHYDFGNQRWANVAGQRQAIYGIPQGEG